MPAGPDMRALPLLLVLALAVPAAAAQQLRDAFPHLRFTAPTDLQAPDDGSNRLFVAEKAGRIRVFENDAAATVAGVFLDIRSRVFSAGDEPGLGALAFDPSFAQNGYFYVSYTAPDPLRLVVSRFRVAPEDPNAADPDSETPLFVVPQPLDSHNAGQLQFGPPEGPGGRRYLYVSLGDGGFYVDGDPAGHGQNPGTLLGTLVRLDAHGGGAPLDCAAGTGIATVPPGNPLADGPGGICDEVYAYGFRNPWRFSFGPDGQLWLGDVGQFTWEEVDLVEAGGNYGWNRLEGTHCYPAPPCDPDGTVLPIWEHRHEVSTSGGFSVIGGYVYEGSNCAALLGRYVYGDYVTGNVWSLAHDGTTADHALLVGLSGRRITTFGRDEQGEVYLADTASGALFGFDCERPVVVTAEPLSPPVVIGPEGGPLVFTLTLANTTDQPQAVEVWAEVDLSDGSEAEFLGPRSFAVPAGASSTTEIEVAVPPGTPAGTATVTVRAGAYPGIPMSADRFTFTKLSTAASEPDAPPAYTALHPVWPNPFADRATLRFDLASPVRVRLAVYDGLGREVALLVDDALEAGAHVVRFEADDLPSGTYLVRLTAGADAATRRVTLVR